jgi:multidrug resistance efflux pump
MIEFFLCSLITIFPDYLYRRYAQGKRIGKEITIYTMWYELRWGLTCCLLLTLSLITVIFYFHPSTSNVTALFRTVTILPEKTGRVTEVYVDVNEKVKAGDLLFRLDSSHEEAALLTAQQRVAEIDALIRVAHAEFDNAVARVEQAQAAFQQAKDEYDTRNALIQEGQSTSVSKREVDRAQLSMAEQRAGVAGAVATRESIKTKLDVLLPAQRATAVAALAQAEVDLSKMTIRAGVDGMVQQFTLRRGDVINPMIRTAGLLVPDDRQTAIVAGFGQIEAQVLKTGMIAEVTCIAEPLKIIPMVITEVQSVIGAGQVRPTDQLLDVQQITTTGTLTTFLEPLYEGGIDNIPPGSSCIANAYSNNHEELESGNVGLGRFLFLHAIDATAMVHAMIIRVQALLLPLQTLVLSGGH